MTRGRFLFVPWLRVVVALATLGITACGSPSATTPAPVEAPASTAPAETSPSVEPSTPAAPPIRQ